VKKILILLIFVLHSISFSSLTSAEETTNSGDKVIITQNLYLEVPNNDATPEELEELKAMYEDAGWVTDGDYFVKQVSHEGVEVKVEDEIYFTDSNGVVELPIDEESSEVEITVSTTPEEESTYVVEVDNGTTSNVIQDIYLDEIIAEMGTSVHDNHEMDTETQQGSVEDSESVTSPLEESTSDDTENVGTVSHGTSYTRGQTVHCNRFNGYLGDGKYYDKFDHPYLSTRNFVQSDCDVALFWYVYCLKDYGAASERYCSNYTDSNKGRCSVLSRVGHSRKYHKHTGFFSPSN
jgi:uncharacterized protein YxeA